MKNRDIFIAGGAIIFFNIAMPLLDGCVNLAISAMNKTINKWQIDMSLDQAEGQAASELISPAGSITHAIGFEIPNIEEGEEYYENE